MSKPVAIAKGIAFAFPDVCQTPAPPSAPIPIPYPNIAQLDQANGKTDIANKEVLVGPSGDYLLLDQATIDTSAGNEAGSVGGVKSQSIKGGCTITGSGNVLYGPDSLKLVRFMDSTEQNDGNTSGFVMSAFPTVLAGG